ARRCRGRARMPEVARRNVGASRRRRARARARHALLEADAARRGGARTLRHRERGDRYLRRSGRGPRPPLPLEPLRRGDRRGPVTVLRSAAQPVLGERRAALRARRRRRLRALLHGAAERGGTGRGGPRRDGNAVPAHRNADREARDRLSTRHRARRAARARVSALRMSRVTRIRPTLADPVQLVATGFGAGLAPRAPGTVGSLVALVPAWLLLDLPLWIRAAVVAALFAAGVLICGES